MRKLWGQITQPAMWPLWILLLFGAALRDFHNGETAWAAFYIILTLVGTTVASLHLWLAYREDGSKRSEFCNNNVGEGE